MTLRKAIEIKRKYQYVLPKESYPELIEADNLSIEALKAQETYRRLGFIRPDQLLPGETEE